MSWRDFFKSNLVRQLELEIGYLRAQIEKQESIHAERLKDVINHNQRLRDELERTRILLSPGLSNISLPHEQAENDESTPPAALFNIPTGTPWQKTLAREIETEMKRGREREAELQAARAKGVTDGNESSGRDASPQRIESAPS